MADYHGLLEELESDASVFQSWNVQIQEKMEIARKQVILSFFVLSLIF